MSFRSTAAPDGTAGSPAPPGKASWGILALTIPSERRRQSPINGSIGVAIPGKNSRQSPGGIPVKMFRAVRLIVVALSVFILAGCGSDDSDDASAPEALEYDLTGSWNVAEESIGCRIVSSDSPDTPDSVLAGLIESSLLEPVETRVVQMGNDFTITNPFTTTQTNGTISGDQVRFTFSEQIMLATYTVDTYIEYEGTVKNADLIAVTDMGSYTLTTPVDMVAIEASCSFEMVRAGQ